MSSIAGMTMPNARSRSPISAAEKAGSHLYETDQGRGRAGNRRMRLQTRRGDVGDDGCHPEAANRDRHHDGKERRFDNCHRNGNASTSGSGKRQAGQKRSSLAKTRRENPQCDRSEKGRAGLHQHSNSEFGRVQTDALDQDEGQHRRLGVEGADGAGQHEGCNV
ncbi:hypothetical protein [Ciceribacter azotifigens]|uniref:hypothetical protein n=1 Tax=Ciceribacter azotifigens TaxID=2069303 RepID=UPI003A89580D